MNCLRLLSVSRRQCALGLLLFYVSVLCAQEQLGMRMERYAGIYGSALNPSAIALNPQRWDVSLFSADAFGNNAYGYIRDASALDVLRNPERVLSVDDPNLNEHPDALVLDFYRGARRTSGVGQARVAGPGFSFRIGEQHTVGLTTAARFQVSTYKLPKQVSYDPLSDIRFFEPTNITPVRFAAAAWGELGFHYAYKMETNNGLQLALGVSPTLLGGVQALYGRANTNFQYTRLANDSISFNGVRWEYGLTTDLLDDDDARRPQRNGMGFALNLGFSLMAPDEGYDSDDDDYKWRFGVSLLDAGAIRFSRNAERHLIETNDTVLITSNDINAFSEPEGFAEAVSQAFLSAPGQSLNGNRFSVGLPTALSLQFDYKITRMLYVSGVAVQRIPLWKNTLRRPATAALIPRFEHRWGSLSVPVVLSDWRSLRMGLAARLGYIAIGSDDIGSWIGKRALTGSDFYIGVKINGFRVKLGGGGRGGLGRSGRKWRKVGCYTF